jgi:hypothetical protein
MRSRDLRREYLAACRGMTLNDVRKLRQFGIPLSAIVRVRPAPIRATVEKKMAVVCAGHARAPGLGPPVHRRRPLPAQRDRVRRSRKHMIP